MQQYDAIETNYRNVFAVWETDIDTGEETQVEAHIDAIETGDSGFYGEGILLNPISKDRVFYVKEGPAEGDFWNAKFLATGFSTMGAALERIRALRETEYIGLYYGE